MPNVLINGESQQQIQPSDRGLTYGDGLFETVQIANGKPLLWDAHMKRLRQGCSVLKIPFSDALLCAIEDDLLILQSNDLYSNAVFKCIITRGIGQRGYKIEGSVSPSRISSIAALPDYQIQQRKGVCVTRCVTQLAQQPLLAGVKHLNRLEQVLARSEWEDESISEGLVFDTQNHIIEGTMSNVFWCDEERLFTPSLQKSGVAGVVRNAIIPLAKKRSIEVVEGDFYWEDISRSTEIFLSNSVINILPVVKIIDRDCEYNFSVGPITKKLQSDLQELYLQESI